MTKKFHLIEILSVFFYENEIFELKTAKNLLQYMLGKNLADYELKSAAEKCRENLEKNFPKIANIDTQYLHSFNKNAWFQEQVKIYGGEHEVEQIYTYYYQKQKEEGRINVSNF
jgi:hypothetical protein